MYRKLRLRILSMLYAFPPTKEYAYRRLPRHRSGYKEYWANAKSEKYRAGTLQHDQAVSQLSNYPSPEELIRIMKAHAPSSILDVGCGYGRFLEILAPHFEVSGCDLSAELLAQVPAHLRAKTFQLDVVRPPAEWVTAHTNAWDVVMCWCVMMYFLENEEETKSAMRTMETLAKDTVIVWEWKHVCDYMQRVYPSDKFEYHVLPVTAAN